jgi:hypothetical protein
MTANRYLAATVALAIGVQAPTAAAVEALSTEELTSHCAAYEEDPDGGDGIFCVRYIQGFIDGAVATDERVTQNVAAEYDRDETYTERAIRTRLGRSLERYGPSFYAEFCLGEPVPLATVVRVVVDDLLDPDRIGGSDLARDVVYGTLRREYPCELEEEDR